MNQVEFVSLEELVSADHVYRKFLSLLDFEKVLEPLCFLSKGTGCPGFGSGVLFKCLLLQFMEDLSDRELERYLQENTSAKFFCGFSLTAKTPDHSCFGKARSRIGTNNLSIIFAQIREQLKRHGYISEIFTFVDATHLISKSQLWEERDKAIQKKYEKLNNEALPKVAHDTQARIGCKRKNKFWYGYKNHVSVDMKHGLINKVACTPANVTDGDGLRHVCPSQGAVVADKAYGINPASTEIKRKGCHSMAILKNNMKDKNKDKDRFISQLRGPYENVFSKRNKRVRYQGVCKNQFASFMNALCFNLKRLVAINAPPLYA
tara:strand:+ start:71 stop:1030 length:960 start_codon:yes stop_codon:yes gene_type:complete